MANPFYDIQANHRSYNARKKAASGGKSIAGTKSARSSGQHKYIRKEWVNGKWKYYYKEQESVGNRGNVGYRGGKYGNYTDNKGNTLTVKKTDKLVGSKRTNRMQTGKQHTVVEEGKLERGARKAANKTKSVAKKTANTIKRETENERTLLKESSTAIKKNLKKKNKKTDKAIKKAVNKATKNVKKTTKKVKKDVEKTKKKAKKAINKALKKIGGNDLTKALKKYANS